MPPRHGSFRQQGRPTALYSSREWWLDIPGQGRGVGAYDIPADIVVLVPLSDVRELKYEMRMGLHDVLSRGVVVE